MNMIAISSLDFLLLSCLYVRLRNASQGKQRKVLHENLISQERENVLFLPSNMAAMTSHENALF